MHARCYDLAAITEIYEGSNGDAAKALYATLMQRGPIGAIAVNVFRAHTNEVFDLHRQPRGLGPLGPRGALAALSLHNRFIPFSDFVDAPGWSDFSLVAINEDGYIAGSGISNGELRGIVLGPGGMIRRSKRAGDRVKNRQKSNSATGNARELERSQFLSPTCQKSRSFLTSLRNRTSLRSKNRSPIKTL